MSQLSSKRFRSGQGLVEFALILPVLMMMVMAILDFGRVMIAYASLSNSLRDAVRFAEIYVSSGGSTAPYRDCPTIISLASRGTFVSDLQVHVYHRKIISASGTTYGQLDPDVQYKDCTRFALPSNYNSPDADIWTGTTTYSGQTLNNDETINNGDILEITVSGSVRIVTPLLSNLVPSLPIRFRAQRTVAKNLYTAGGTSTGSTGGSSSSGGGSTTSTLSMSPSADFSVTEGGTATINLTLSPAKSSAATINVEIVSGGTASTGTDFTLSTTSVSMTASGSVSIPITDDIYYEGSETFSVRFSTSDTSISIPDDTIVITITDNETQPTLSIDDAADVTEASGTVNATFTIRLSSASTQDVLVSWITGNDSPPSAVAGTDYYSGSGNVTFTAGQTTKTITVQIKDDLLDEANEYFVVNVSTAASGILTGDLQGRAKIVDDDATPTIYFNPATVSQTESTTTMTFTVWISAISGQNVSVQYTTAASSPVSASTSDYNAITTPLTLNIAAGAQNATFNVTIVNDTTVESDETFVVNLSNPTNATITAGQSQAVGTIVDNDTSGPLLRILDAPLTGTIGESPAAVTIKMTLSVARTSSFTFRYSTQTGVISGTNFGTATAGTDFTTKTNVAVTFPANATEMTFTISSLLLQDTVDEADEWFSVKIISVSDSAVTIADDIGVVTITDDDPTPTMAISASGSPASVTEGTTGATTNVTFPVTLSAVTYQNVTVNYSVSGSGVDAADFSGSTSGTLTFVPSDTSETITVTVAGDTLYEANETFTVTLSNWTNVASVTTSYGTATITNDDTPPAIVFADQTFAESVGNAGVAVTLQNVSGTTATVNYTTTSTGYTTTAGTDYTTTSGTLTFLAGSTTPQQAISVPISNDAATESNETFGVTLSSPSGATLSPSPLTRTMTITDDDSSTTFKVQVRYMPWGSTQVVPYMTIVNNSSSAVAWKEFKIRYYYTNDGATMSFTCNGNPWYVCQSIAWASGTTNGVTYQELNFSNTDPSRTIAAGGSEEVQFVMTGSTNLNAANDYSYVAGATNPTDAPKIVLYRNGSVVWGTPP